MIRVAAPANDGGRQNELPCELGGGGGGGQIATRPRSHLSDSGDDHALVFHLPSARREIEAEASEPTCCLSAPLFCLAGPGQWGRGPPGARA